MQAYQKGDRDTRPWGSYVVTNVGTTATGEEFCEKEITVLPGKILSLQSHEQRRELWRVVSGTLTIVVDEQKKILNIGDDIYIAQGSIHAMANTSDAPCVVFERQEGVCREDDIKRYIDAYGRVTEPSDHPAIGKAIAHYKSIMNAMRSQT